MAIGLLSTGASTANGLHWHLLHWGKKISSGQELILKMHHSYTILMHRWLVKVSWLVRHDSN